MRLKRSFRYSIYAAFSVLVLTGAGWLAADWQKGIPGDDIWQQLAADMMMVHGGAAMLALLLLGALIPVHVLGAWRSGKNRVSGSVVAASNAVLVLTAFALYYVASEAMRPWVSWIHIVAGLSLATMLPLHVVLGSRHAAAQACEPSDVAPGREMAPHHGSERLALGFEKDQAETVR